MSLQEEGVMIRVPLTLFVKTMAMNYTLSSREGIRSVDWIELLE
jgi:hypothetical protein